MPPSPGRKHPLPLWTRWFIVLIVLLMILGGTILWIIQGTQAIFPVAILTSLGILISFSQILPSLFPRKEDEDSTKSIHEAKIETGIINQAQPSQISQSSPPSTHTISPLASETTTTHDTALLTRNRDLDNTTIPRIDYGEAPQTEPFYGRDQELAELKRWVVDEQCHIVAILGIGGIGKTSLAVMLVDQIKNSFEYVLWRSLQNAPPLKDILQDCLKFVSNFQQTNLPEDIDSQISLLISYLREHHCLIVLDNIESILQEGKRAGYYREGYENYGLLFQRIGETRHESCLLITSREKPKEIAHLEGVSSPARSYQLEGLHVSEGRDILKDKGLHGSEQNRDTLVEQYEGNPLVLKLVSQFIREVFDGDIASFLKDKTIVISDIRDVLDQQFKRLSGLERQLMYWLALEREAVTLDDLQKDMISSVTIQELRESLRSLRRRYLVQRNLSSITLQNVIMEYITDLFIKQIAKEIQEETLDLFDAYALMKAQSKEYLRESQVRFIIVPIIQRLFSSLGEDGTQVKLKHILAVLHKNHHYKTGYSSANILHLLIHLGYDLRGYDFSHLKLRQVYLQGKVLPEVNFTYTNFVSPSFTDTFDNIRAISFNKNGKMISIGTTNSEIWIWQLADNTLLQIFNMPEGWIRSVAFSPDGSVLASGGDDQTVRLWDISTGHCHILQGHTDHVTSVVFNFDGTLVASSCHDHTVRLWDTSTGHCLYILQEHTDRVKSVAFSPDGTILASGGDDQIVRLWEVETGHCLRTLQGHSDRVKSVAFSPDGTILASGGDDQMVRLWEVETGHCLSILQGHSDRVQSVVFSPDGATVASSGRDQVVRAWDIKTGRCYSILQGHGQWIWSIAFNPDGTVLASGGDDQTVRLWDIKTGRCFHTWQGYTGSVLSVAFSPDGATVASGSADQIVRVWNVNRDRCLYALQGHSKWVWSVAFSPDGKFLASGSGDQTVRVWEASTGYCLHTLQGHNKWVKSVAFSPDGKLLASGGRDQVVKVWAVSSGDCLHTLQGHNNVINSIAFSPDGKFLASGSGDQTVRVWEVSSGNCLRSLQGLSSAINSIAFSPDGQLLASGGDDQTVRVWEVNNGNCLCILQGHHSAVNSIAFSPDGQLLASGGDQVVRLWELNSESCLYILQGHSSRVTSVNFHSNGYIIASGSDDGTIKLWDIQTYTCLKTWRGERPYENMSITGASGLTDTQKISLRKLGAIDQAESKDH